MPPVPYGWYAVLRSGELRPGQGRQPALLRARPHRLPRSGRAGGACGTRTARTTARISAPAGRSWTATVECPFHGWRFGADGPVYARPVRGPHPQGVPRRVPGTRAQRARSSSTPGRARRRGRCRRSRRRRPGTSRRRSTTCAGRASTSRRCARTSWTSPTSTSSTARASRRCRTCGRTARSPRSAAGSTGACWAGTSTTPSTCSCTGRASWWCASTAPCCR